MFQYSVLHIEDEKWFHQQVKLALKEVQVIWASSIQEGLQVLKHQQVDLILLDRNLSGEDSFESIGKLVDASPGSAILVLSTDAEGGSIEKALQLGAHDYLIKSPKFSEELPIRIKVAIKAKSSDRILNQKWLAPKLDSEMIGVSAHIRALQEKVMRLSELDINVLITGESGTGKEVIASEIHRLRRDNLRPFVALNCGAISESVFESELFGHVKGAFTGASMSREGLLVAADGGDLFLDEVGDLPQSQQVKLLRFIQDGTFIPVGSTKELRSKVRIIAATNKSLEQEVSAGRFREDLFYRLDVYRIHTKALRERTEDIGPLADFFVQKFSNKTAKINKEAKKLLERQVWKGNVRELIAVLQRALVESMGDDIRASHIQVQNIGGSTLQGKLPKLKGDVNPLTFNGYVDSAAKAYLENALNLFEGDTQELAAALSLSRATIYNKMNRLKLRSKKS
jgi:hypothetical protein